MYSPEVTEKIANIRAMADNIMKAPSGHRDIEAFTAQALRDIADALHLLRVGTAGIVGYNE